MCLARFRECKSPLDSGLCLKDEESCFFFPAFSPPMPFKYIDYSDRLGKVGMDVSVLGLLEFEYVCKAS